MSRRPLSPTNVYRRQADPLPPLFPQPTEGDIYFNTISKRLRIFDDGKWLDATVTPGEGDDRYVMASGDIMTGALTLSGHPTAGLHASTKQYTDDGDALRVAKAGDTMTGFLTLSGNPTSNLHATPRQYVVAKSGDTMTGALTLPADPSVAMHAATKKYTDDRDALRVAKAGDTISGDLVTASGVAYRAAYSVQSDANDGIIAARRFARGLNIVGNATEGDGQRHISVWGRVTHQSGHSETGDEDFTRRVYVDTGRMAIGGRIVVGGSGLTSGNGRYVLGATEQQMTGGCYRTGNGGIYVPYWGWYNVYHRLVLYGIPSNTTGYAGVGSTGGIWLHGADQGALNNGWTASVCAGVLYLQAGWELCPWYLGLPSGAGMQDGTLSMTWAGAQR